MRQNCYSVHTYKCHSCGNTALRDKLTGTCEHDFFYMKVACKIAGERESNNGISFSGGVQTHKERNVLFL